MKLKLRNFLSVNFHDSRLLKVEERSGYILLKIDSGLVWLPMGKPESKAKTIHECTLECFGVTVSEKKGWNDARPKQWNDNRLAEPCSNSSAQIVEISGNEVVDNFLVLVGFTNHKKSVAWRITAQYYELNWEAEKEFADDYPAVSRIISPNGVCGLNFTKLSSFSTRGLRRRISSKPGA